jgi:hypothetical protein
MTSNNEIVKMAMENALRKVEDAGRTIAEIELADDPDEQRVRKQAREKLLDAHRLIRNLWKVYESKCLKQAFFEFDQSG